MRAGMGATQRQTAGYFATQAELMEWRCQKCGEACDTYETRHKEPSEFWGMKVYEELVELKSSCCDAEVSEEQEGDTE